MLSIHNVFVIIAVLIGLVAAPFVVLAARRRHDPADAVLVVMSCGVVVFAAAAVTLCLVFADAPGPGVVAGPTAAVVLLVALLGAPLTGPAGTCQSL